MPSGGLQGVRGMAGPPVVLRFHTGLRMAVQTMAPVCPWAWGCQRIGVRRLCTPPPRRCAWHRAALRSGWPSGFSSVPPVTSLAPGSPLGPMQPQPGGPCGPEPPADSSAPSKTPLKCVSVPPTPGFIILCPVSQPRVPCRQGSQRQVVPRFCRRGARIPEPRGRARARGE